MVDDTWLSQVSFFIVLVVTFVDLALPDCFSPVSVGAVLKFRGVLELLRVQRVSVLTQTWCVQSIVEHYALSCIRELLLLIFWHIKILSVYLSLA